MNLIPESFELQVLNLGFLPNLIYTRANDLVGLPFYVNMRGYKSARNSYTSKM